MHHRTALSRSCMPRRCRLSRPGAVPQQHGLNALHQPQQVVSVRSSRRAVRPAPSSFLNDLGRAASSALTQLTGAAAAPPKPTRPVTKAVSVQEQQPPLSRRAQDYAASPSDEGVLRLPPRTELEPSMITHVFGYARNLLERYYIGKVIGAGSFGVVRECVDIANGRKCAIKTVCKTPKRGPPTPRYLLKLRTEVEIMQQLGYSLDAVNLRDVFEDADSIHLVMELCEGGALLERIEQRKYSEAYIAGVIRRILRFISQCHAKGIIYRDVKPDNFLFLTRGEDSHLKATDFGLSIRHWPDQDKLNARSGTPAYMAPELVLQSYDSKCDVWSVGMLSYQLLTGRFPFWDDVRSATLSDVWKAILTKDVDWNAEELRTLSPEAVDFLKTLLQREPERRPTAQQALQHAWLQEQGPGGDRPLQGSVVQRLQRFSTYGNLKQLVLKMIVDQIQGNSSESPAGSSTGGGPSMVGLEELFELLDTDNSGGISIEELTVGLKRQGYQLAQSEVDQLVRGIDLDQDRSIRLPEFITTMLDWNIIQAQHNWQQYLDRVFSHLDKDGDGYIDLEELTILLKESTNSGEQVDEQEQVAAAKQMLREADLNGDGRISKEEFYKLLHVSHAPDSLCFYDDRLPMRSQAPEAA